MNKKTRKKKKGGTRRARSMSPNRLQKSRVSRNKLANIHEKLKRISSKRNKFNRTLKSSKNRAKYGSHIQKKLDSLKHKEIMLHRQIPRTPLRRVRSASAKAPNRPHTLHRRVLSRMRRPNESESQHQRRIRRGTVREALSRAARPRSPVFDFN